MPIPSHSTGDFVTALKALLPSGRVWPRHGPTVLDQTLKGLAPTFARHYARAAQLIYDAFPSQASELLPEWEYTLGLPDPCAGAAPTLQARRQQVVARLSGNGGQSIAYITAYALALGYTITITQYTMAVAGILRAGQPIYGPAWAHAWSVNAPLQTFILFRAGLSAAGEPLASWGNAVLECEISAIAPAHTKPLFAYASTGSPFAPLDLFILGVHSLA